MSTKLYFLALLPPDDLKKEIKKLKEDFAQKYHCYRALRLPAHITLVPPFRITEEREPVLVKTLTCFCDNFSEIKIVLEDFGAFPPGVIFIEVKNPESIRPFRNQLLGSMSIVLENANSAAKRQFQPHITLATRDLKKEDFYRAWEVFKNKSFNIHFLVSGLTLFKHNGKEWEELHTFPFQLGKI